MISQDGETFDRDYSHYRTIYRAIESGAQFSNNGNVYTRGGDFDPSDLTRDEIQEYYVLSNQELTECVADLMYEVSCLQLGLQEMNKMAYKIMKSLLQNNTKTKEELLDMADVYYAAGRLMAAEYSEIIDLIGKEAID